MSEHAFRIFVVDDDPVAQMITVDRLGDPGFEVSTFGSGEECLAAMAQSPDLILMDIEMPGEDGIAVCRRLREEGDTHAQVIFVSARDDIDTRLAAYDAGGNDFIVKPVAPEELEQKVRVAQRFLDRHRGLAQDVQSAQQSAFTAFSYMSEMGTVIQFLRASFGLSTAEELARAMFETMGQYGLQCIVEIRDDAGGRCFSSKGECTPLEESIVRHARGMDRIFQFHDRMAINYPRVTLLVPNLPMDDPDRIGRLRDHLAIVAEGAEARLEALASERKRLAQANGIIAAMNDLTKTLQEIDAQQGANRRQLLDAANAYLQDMEHAFVHLGLSGGQEAELVAMATRATEGFSHIQHAGMSLGDRLRQVTAELNRLAAG
jgi:DNA-binding response OmpR family regulator